MQETTKSHGFVRLVDLDRLGAVFMIRTADCPCCHPVWVKQGCIVTVLDKERPKIEALWVLRMASAWPRISRFHDSGRGCSA